MTALALLLGAARMLTQSSRDFPYNATVQMIHDGGQPSPRSLAALADLAFRQDQAGALHGAALEDAGIIAAAYATAPRISPLFRPALLLEAERVNADRIAEAPADSHAWIRLATLRAARVGIDREVLDALRMSRFTGPREFAVMWPSLKFRVANWDKMPEDERIAAADILAGLWRRASRPDAVAYFEHLPIDRRADLLDRMTDSEAKAALVPYASPN